MTLLYQNELFLEHETGSHPERSLRLRKINEKLETEGLAAKCVRPKWKPATIDDVARNHDRRYVERVADFAKAGGGYIEADTVVSPRSYDAAMLASGAAIDAVRRVVEGEDKTAFCVHRPPGHHAVPGDAMGFCLFNHVAVAARYAVESLQLNRVLVVDWDVHHGNGTQDSFWRDGKIGFLSIHRSPFYPGTGAADETGAGPGLGMIKNIPLRFGTTRERFLEVFRGGLEKLADAVKPELILLSAGFDAHRDDPIGSLGLESEDFAELSKIVLEVAAAHAKGRVVSLLEGGYNVDRLADSVAIHVEKLLAANDKP
jgi:acetoin utilization deacetylase AcuC-like enzyme